MHPHQGRLFAKMWHTARNNCKFTGIAIAAFSRKTVRITPAWTKVTRLQPFLQQTNPVFKYPQLVGFNIRWHVITGHNGNELILSFGIGKGLLNDQGNKIIILGHQLPADC